MKKRYFDYAATSPTDPQVVKAMEPYFFERFGNPSSPHSFGREAQKALEDSRTALARFIGARPEEIIFTSCATEANNLALIGSALRLKDRGNHIIISSVEHHAVWRPAEYLKEQGFDVTVVSTDQDGLLDPQDIKKALTDRTVLVSVIHASNEIGTIQPIAEISRIIKEKNILFHTDAVQALGQVNVDVNALGVDLLALGAHKFYGPKGIGALYVRKGVELTALMLGGDQERSRRAGTVNVAFAVGLAKAIELCEQNMAEETQKQMAWRDHLLNEIPRRIEGVKINGHRHKRLPKNVHVSFEGVWSDALLINLDLAGIAASMGSACTAGSMKVSRVLKAIGLSDGLALGALRLSLGRWTTQEDIDVLLNELPKIVKQLRK